MKYSNKGLDEYLLSHGYSIPEYKINDIVRFNAPGKPESNKDAWIKVLSNGSAIFGDWISGNKFFYFPDIVRANKTQRYLMTKEFIELSKKHREKEEQDHMNISIKATLKFNSLQFCPVYHPYLRLKRIQNHQVKMNFDGAIVIPVLGSFNDLKGKIQSLQFIYANGRKRFYKGGKMKGGYFPVQWKGEEQIVICEGFATGATLAEHYFPNSCVVCAFNSGNLITVSKFFRQNYPKSQIIIAGDNDHKNSKNIGKLKAIEAANLVMGQCHLPDFNDGEIGSDWNDRYLLDFYSYSEGGQ